MTRQYHNADQLTLRVFRALGPLRRPPPRTRADRNPASGPGHDHPHAADPALLDQLLALGDILPDLPSALKARLFAAFGLEILWNKPGQQATVFTEITENTLQAIPGITDPGQDGYRDTSTDDVDPGQPAPMWDLTDTNGQQRAARRRLAIMTTHAHFRARPCRLIRKFTLI